MLLFFYFANATDCGSLAKSATESLKSLSCDLAQEEIGNYSKKADPCVLSEILDGSIMFSFQEMTSGFGFFNNGEITTEKLRQVANEIVRPTKFNKSYHNHLNRPELKKFFNGLADHLESKGLTRTTYAGLAIAAYSRLDEAKKNGEVGECYSLQSFGGVKYIVGTVSRPVNVSSENQKKIEDLMKNAQSVGYHFSDVDAELYRSKRLTIEELKELKALRKSSAVFEQATFLKNDEAGGFISNFKGELLGGDQVNCYLETQNHTAFISKLAEKGMLKEFEVAGTVSRPMELSKKDLTASGHVAVVLKNKRTGEEFVYDSWFEKGGEAAHILTKEDWENLSLDFKNKFRDIVPEK